MDATSWSLLLQLIKVVKVVCLCTTPQLAFVPWEFVRDSSYYYFSHGGHTHANTEFAMPKQKNFGLPHVPNFEELGFKVGPSWMFTLADQTPF